MPTAPSRLMSVIAGGIPHRLRDRDAQCLYLRGALALAEAPAAAAVREGILAAAAEHLLSLDVEIRWQDIAAAEAGAHMPICTSGRLAPSCPCPLSRSFTQRTQAGRLRMCSWAGALVIIVRLEA